MRSRFEFLGVKVRYIPANRPRRVTKFLNQNGFFFLLPDGSIGLSNSNWFRGALAEYSRSSVYLARAMFDLGAIDTKTLATYQAEYQRRRRQSEAEDAAHTITEHAVKIGLKLTAAQRRALNKPIARAA